MGEKRVTPTSEATKRAMAGDRQREEARSAAEIKEIAVSNAIMAPLEQVKAARTAEGDAQRKRLIKGYSK